MPQELEKEVSNHFKGLKRKVASVIAAGGGKIKVGKDPLAFSLYRFLGLILLQLDTRDSIFARTFMIIAWNLMARSANTFDICISHMEWQGDALCIYFSQMKNDQMGERPRDPCHIYMLTLCVQRFVVFFPLVSFGLVMHSRKAKCDSFQGTINMTGFEKYWQDWWC